MADHSPFKRMVLKPGTPYWKYYTEMKNKNSNQIEDIFAKMLKDSNIALKRANLNAMANKHFRIGSAAGIFFVLSVLENLEICLVDEDPVVKHLAKMLHNIVSNNSEANHCIHPESQSSLKEEKPL